MAAFLKACASGKIPAKAPAAKVNKKQKNIILIFKKMLIIPKCVRFVSSESSGRLFLWRAVERAAPCPSNL